ncbi:MAG: hypothetical protein AB1Z98_18035 [Nannocystaceae bacterium]
MPKTLDDILNAALDRYVWTSPESDEHMVRVSLVSRDAMFVEMIGRVSDDAVPTLRQGLREFARQGATNLYWDVSRIEHFESGIRDTSLDFVREFSDQLGEFNVCTVSAPWGVKMGVRLADMLMKGKITNFSDRASFISKLGHAQ